MISALPADQQETIKNELTANKDNPEKISELLKSKFSEEQMQKRLEEVSSNFLTEWMQAVNPTLTDEQRQKLVALSQEFNPTPQPSPTV